MRYLIVLALGCACPAIVSASNNAREFQFWPGNEAAQDPRVIRIQPHACGVVAIAKVSLMPPYRADAAIKPEPVVELSPKGRRLHQWAIPVDAEIRAIRGSQLLVTYQGLLMWFKSAGRFSIAKPHAHLEAVTAVGCVPPAEFAGSNFKVCHLYKDLSSHRPRILANEGPCS